MSSNLNRLTILGGIRSLSFSIIWPYIGFALYNYYKFSLTLVSIYYAIQAVSGSIAYLIGGYSADALGRKKTMLYSSSLSSLSLFLCFISSSPLLVFTFLQLQTFFNSIYGSANTTAVGDTEGSLEKLILSFSRFRIGVNIGWAIGPAIGGFLYQYLGFKEMLLVASLGSLVSIPIVLLLSENKGSKIALIKPSKQYVKFLIPAFLTFVVMSQLGFSFLTFLATVPKIPVNLVGLLFTLNGLLVAALQEPIGRIIHKRNPIKMISFGMIGYGISYFSMALVKDFLDAVVITVGITLSEMVVSPIANALANYMAEKEHRGKYMGLFGLISLLGRVTGQSVSSELMEYFLYEPFYLWSFILLMGLISSTLYYILLGNSVDRLVHPRE
ncbi:MAG: MFS transporter [Sulfolobaceae archaeon]|nr:MFS transporter [Sulfolobaceae archaeon]